MENGNASYFDSNAFNGHAPVPGEVLPPPAPVAQSSGVTPKVSVMDYSTDFPKLPDAPAPAASKPAGGAWGRGVAPVHSQVITQRFQLAGDERARAANGKSFGALTEEQQRCNQIATDTKTSIELSEAKDGTLTVIITGKRKDVETARSKLVTELQTQVNREISIPKDHHRWLIGKDGAKLKELELETNTRIMIPKKDQAGDTIKIVGPREGIDRAVERILAISTTQAKLATEHIVVPKIYYPWIRGPNNETLDRLIEETKAKINIPPSTAKSEVIVVTGEKEGVHKAAATIRAIYAEKEAKAKALTCTVARAQHRYVIGSQRRGLSDILKETDVSVEVPGEDEDSDQLTLRGDPAKLPAALALVYAKASSVITADLQAPVWLHKFLIGPKGATLQTLVPNRGKVQVDFDNNGTIFIEGSPEEVKAAQTALDAEVKRLIKEMAIETIKVHPTLHRHVIGRGGALISKIKDETGVQISIPNEATNSDEIVVEGKKDGVKKAVAQIKEIVTKIENEKSRDIIIEQRLHKLIIGTKGGEIQKLRDAHPTVNFSFPEPNKKSDVINLRGDKAEVDQAFAKLTKIAKELAESNYQSSVPIFKEFHKHIIGKGGATVRRIREETQTRIDLPEGNSGEDKILVTGKKANVEKAIDQLNKIQDELASIVVTEVNIPVKVQARLLGGGRRLILDIQDECGGVHIKFPNEKSNSEKVSIRGPKDDVAKAERLLTNLAKDKEASIHEDSVKAKHEFHRFIIGKGGSRINKLREKYGGDIRIMFPREGDADQEVIHLLGKKEDVEAVKKELEALITQLNETVEIKVPVDQKFHAHFVARGAAVLKEIQEQNGGVHVAFPPRGSESTEVTIKGSKQCVESAKTRIEEIVSDMIAQVTITVEVPAVHHRVLLRDRGTKVQEIQTRFNVSIRFPDRKKEEAETEEVDGAADVIRISGRDTNAEAAREALLALVPISKSVQVPVDLHRYLIGKGGEVVRKIMQDNDVNVAIPKDNSGNDEIVVTGTVENVENALQDINAKVEQLNKEAEDRKLKSFQLTLDVPSSYHQKIIGQKGATVNALREKHDVQISLPRDGGDTITITGFETNANACKEEIESIVEGIRSLFTQEISLDVRFHPRIIGQKGRTVRKLMDEFGVEIRFPRDDSGIVIVSGKDENAVFDCIDYLRSQEEEWAEDQRDRTQYLSQRNAEQPKPAQPTHVQIQGAPWQLDLTSQEDFPDMGAPAPAAATAGGVWGRRPF